MLLDESSRPLVWAITEVAAVLLGLVSLGVGTEVVTGGLLTATAIAGVAGGLLSLADKI